VVIAALCLPMLISSPEMGPVLAALALLFINGYGMLSLSPNSGRAPRAALIASLLIGATYVPAASAVSVASPRSAAVLRAWRGAGAKSSSADTSDTVLSRAQPPTAPATLSLRGGGEVIHTHRFEMKKGSYFETTTTKEGDVVKARFSVDSSTVEQLTLHWGVAVNSDDEWLTPQKANCEQIIPKNSILYKDRAIRSKMRTNEGTGKLELEIIVPATAKVLGIRFVLWEHDKDNWYPGGAGGNFYAPVIKVRLLASLLVLKYLSLGIKTFNLVLTYLTSTRP